tara:strand:+ start:2363 stop:3835 length:1473 start_codon:yes stop_codon:yes gene_type:complete
MDFLGLQAVLRPRKLAINDLTHDRQWHYAELDQWVGQLVTFLTERNLKAGDRLACLSKNRAEIIALHLACARAGIIFVPLNWRLSKEEIEALIDDAKPALLIGDELAVEHSFEHYPMDKIYPESQHCDVGVASAGADAPCLILYTSGTTGRPKGVMHTEATIMETTINMALLGQVDELSVFLCETPMFHVIGLVSCIRPALNNGGTLVISDGFEPGRTLHRMMDPALNISHYFCVPQMANMLRQHADFSVSSLANLKGLLTGGAPHPEVQIRAWLNDGIPIVDGYGMSEAGTVFGMPFDIPSIDAHAGCVGVATPRLQIRLLNDDGDEVADGEPGEVMLKGDNLFVGIWGQENVYQSCFNHEGWFHTGDIAVKNAAGFYRIVDRKKDMFISGGENVYPVEVEGVTLKIEGIADCALVGVPDEKWGEVGQLFVVAKNGFDFSDSTGLLEEIATHVARYKVPKYVTQLDVLPRNGAGKVMKHVLRKGASAGN